MIPRHPAYNTTEVDRHRLVLDSGVSFKDRFLKQHYKEDYEDFNLRSSITPIPSFAKSSLLEIAKAFAPRLSQITRTDGTVTYLEACNGRLGGVDLHSSSMTSFIVNKVILEMLGMGRIGIFVDNFAQDKAWHPYIYDYKIEDIWNYNYLENNPAKFERLVLRDNIYTKSPDGLPESKRYRYRDFQLTDSGVLVRYFTESGEQVDQNLKPSQQVQVLNLTRIPFVMPEISEPLLRDICYHQIALLNLASADMWYTFKGNIPIFARKKSKNDFSDVYNKDKPKVSIGVSEGIEVPSDVDYPTFITPSTDTLKASIEKQEQLKAEIRNLLHLALSMTAAKNASAESKSADFRGLESGIAAIASILQATETEIAKIWAEYEGSDLEPTISYPNNYELLSALDQIDVIERLDKLRNTLPSETGQREIMKLNVDMILGGKVPSQVLSQIKTEIDNSNALNASPETVDADMAAGLVSTETASRLRGYPQGEVEQAKIDHADRLYRIAIAQTEGAAAARGVGDLSPIVGGQS